MLKICDKNSVSQEYIINLNSLSLWIESLFFLITMPKLIIIVILFLFTLSGFAQSNNSWSVTGNVFLYEDNLSGTGIKSIYIFKELTGAEISFTSDASVVQFYKYTSSVNDQQIIPASEISSISSGGVTTYTIKNPEDGKGYFAKTDGGQRDVIWIIDYSMHHPQLNSIEFNEGDDKCEYLQLRINKADDLYFYATSGIQHRLIRRYDITYSNEKWDSEHNQFVKNEVVESQKDIGVDFTIEAPLANTNFKISGDQIAKYFGLNFEAISDTYTAVRTEPHIVAEMINEDGTVSTQIEGETLSAPAEISFKGRSNGLTAFYVWNIYKTTDTKNSIVRYTDMDINFAFREAGDYIVKLETFDQNSSCNTNNRDSIKFSITDFNIKVPNFIILDGTHQFKIKYQSVFNFKCTIFNRWGNKIYEFKDPSQGWDGKYNGRLVSTGVYYYVITAENGNKEKRTLKGYINALRPK